MMGWKYWPLRSTERFRRVTMLSLLPTKYRSSQQDISEDGAHVGDTGHRRIFVVNTGDVWVKNVPLQKIISW